MQGNRKRKPKTLCLHTKRKANTTTHNNQNFFLENFFHFLRDTIIDFQDISKIFGKLYNLLKTKNKNNWLLHKFNINLCLLKKQPQIIQQNNN